MKRAVSLPSTPPQTHRPAHETLPHASPHATLPSSALTLPVRQSPGMKLIYDTKNLAENCQLCEKIERKKRRLDKAVSDYKRWEDDPSRRASRDKARDDIYALKGEIERLTNERHARYVTVGNPRRG